MFNEIVWDEYEIVRAGFIKSSAPIVMASRTIRIDAAYHAPRRNLAVYDGDTLVGMLSHTEDYSYMRANLFLIVPESKLPTGVHEAVTSYLTAEADTWGLLGFGLTVYD